MGFEPSRVHTLDKFAIKDYYRPNLFIKIKGFMLKIFGIKTIALIALYAVLAQATIPFLVLTPQQTFAQEATPTVAPSPTDTPSSTPTVTQTPDPSPSPSVVPTDSASPSPSDTPAPSDTPSPTPVPSPINTVTQVSTPAGNLSPPSQSVQTSATLVSSQWQTNPDGSATTVNIVSLNQVYKAPQNDKVTVTFTKLPDKPGKLTITEVKLTPDQQKATGALSDTAYNITSDMTDGTFLYDLTLPVPGGTQGESLGVKSSETVDGLKNSSANQANQSTSGVVTITGLNHFTIFVVVVNLQPTYAAPGGGGVYSAYYGPPSYNAVSPGETAVYDGREAGIIKAGINADTNGHYYDQGLIAFKPGDTPIETFATQPFTYDFVNQYGANPVWVYIELNKGLAGDVMYQYVPTTNPSSWHTEDAGTGTHWQQWTNLTDGITTGPMLSLSDIATANLGKTVSRVYLSEGIGDSYHDNPNGTVAWVDKVVIGSAEYDFTTQPACNGSSFDSFNLGSVNGQGGWSITGNYEQAVVDNSYNYSSFGCKSLRLSDSITSGSFGDQLFAPPQANGAGETSATAGTFSVGTRQNHFETQFDIASTMLTQQPGLHLSVSPDRGDGSRMIYLRFEDNADGIDVFFDDVQGTSNPANFVETKIGTLDRTIPHTIKISMDFLNGPSNDIVKVYIDGTLVHTGTSWENYYRYDSEASAEPSPRIVKTVLFRQAGTAVPADAGNGFLIDNFSTSTSTVNPTPTTNPATGEALTSATVNGTNGEIDASNTSFWWGTTSAGPFNSCASCNSQLPSGWTHDSGLVGKAAGAPFSENLTGLTSGTQYYFVAWSQVGGIWYPGAVETFNTVSPDTTPPDVPTLISPVNGVYRHTSNLNKSEWSPETDPSSPVVYYYESSLSTDTNSDGSFKTTAYKSSALTLSEIMNPGEPEVTYYWHVKACDAVGNCSNWSPAWQIHIDNTAPTVPVNGLPNAVYIPTNNFDFTWDNSSDASPITYEFQSSLNSAQSGGILTTGLWKSGVLLSNMIHSSGAPDGKWYWQVRAIDAAGNTSAWSQIWNVTLDTIAPTVNLIFPTPGPSATGFQAVFSENVNSTEATDPANYFLHNWPGAGGSGNLVGHATILYDSTSHIATITFTTPGWYISPEQQWGVQNIHDLAGNLQSINPFTAYSTPMTPPTTPVASPVAGDYNSDQSVTLTSSDSGSGLKNIYYTTDGTTPDNTKTLYTGAITVDHDMTIKAIAYDNAGNSSGILSATYGVPPVISNEVYTRSSDTSLTITWTTNYPATSRVVYDTVPHAVLGSAPDYGYAYSTATFDTSPEVTSHSVLITGLTTNTDYYYRVISGGSPEAVGGEQEYTLHYIFGLPGDGLSDGRSDGLSDGGSTGAPSSLLTQNVLGASTFAGNTLSENGNSGTLTPTPTPGEVLGASTQSAQETVKTAPVKVQTKGMSSTIIRWFVIALIAFFFGLFLYRRIFIRRPQE